MKKESVHLLRCNEAAKYICENLDERLDSPKCRAIKKHLQTCPKCVKDLADLKKIIAFYRKESIPRISKNVQKRLLTSLMNKKRS
jgi:anti-sigma factor RsiW